MPYGFIKAAALSPKTVVADPRSNGEAALSALLRAQNAGVQLAVLPELTLSSYTCADLFHHNALISGCEEALSRLLSATASLPLIYFTDKNKISPLTAPNFCMLLRKHIGSGKPVRLVQADSL